MGDNFHCIALMSVEVFTHIGITQEAKQLKYETYIEMLFLAFCTSVTVTLIQVTKRQLRSVLVKKIFIFLCGKFVMGIR